MRRLLLTTVALLGLSAASAPAASAARHCPRHGSEHAVARSAQAVVFTRMARQSRDFSQQTITGCSRRSGRRRVIATLERRGDHDPTRLVGLKLAGTRVAYLVVLAPPNEATPQALVADDAVRGGRRHVMALKWPFDSNPNPVRTWAVDADGEVVWSTAHDPAVEPISARPPALYAWRPGRGPVRHLDSHADFRDLRVAAGVVRWRHNGAPRVADLRHAERSACPPGPTAGTLDIDVYGYVTLCRRSTGRMEDLSRQASVPELLDVNGSRMVFRWMFRWFQGAYVVDVADGTGASLGDRTFPTDAVVDDHGSVAWTDSYSLWVRDATGIRQIPGDPGSDTLLRDGSTVTWAGGGPTVTLNP